MKRIAAALTVALAAVALTVVPSVVRTPSAPVPSDDLIVSGAVVRFTEAGPRWHINDAHHAVGLIDTSTEPFINSDGFLEFNLLPAADGTHYPVVSMALSPDETMAARGLMAGGSGGVSSVRVRISKPSIVEVGAWSPLNLNLPAHYDRVEGANSNLWITLVHDAS